MYIDKRTLNPFFKKTNSTPQDLLDWIEFLMKGRLDRKFPCISKSDSYLYMNRYSIYWHRGFEGNYIKKLIISDKLSCFELWDAYRKSHKQPLLDAIKEFKEKYNL